MRVLKIGEEKHKLGEHFYLMSVHKTTMAIAELLGCACVDRPIGNRELT